MEIKNVISNEELKVRLDSLIADNWKIRNIFHDVGFSDAKDAIDNWPDGTRNSLLKMLKVKENIDYKKIYHNIN